MELSFQEYSFVEKENQIEVTYLTFFSFLVPREEFNVLGAVSFRGNTVSFDKLPEERARKKLDFIFSKYQRTLKYKINNNPVILVGSDNPLPLLGLQFLGIIDKGSEMIEIKPITNCNMNCTFCSVDEGPDSRKQIDFVVEPEYLLEQFNFFMKQKQEGKYNIWINPHGEPLLYAPIADLVRGLRKNQKVGDLIIITNGMLLTKALIDDLADAGLTRFSVSFHAIDESKAKQLFGTKAYNLNKVKEMVAYAAKKVSVALTPVYLKGINEDEIVKIIDWANEIGVSVEIQKFCINKRGRNPLKEQSWESFFDALKKIQEKSNTKLLHDLGKLKETNELQKPFKKGEVIDVEIVCQGRMTRDKIGIAKDRAVLILNCEKGKGRARVKLIQSKHNVFLAVPA